MRLRLPGIAVAMMSVVLVAKPPLPNFITSPSGLQYVDMRPGKGRTPAPGQTCAVLYRGWLYNDKQRGKMFDSAQDARKPFRFPLAQGQVIPGWDEGVASMKAGGKRVLIVPPNLGYGEQGSGSAIPPGATLLFEVELLGFK
jgi:FKBP-type peptidyl-prolyl cis-trans isomerase